MVMGISETLGSENDNFIIDNFITLYIIIINYHNGSGKFRKFSRSRMTKWTASLNSSCEI